MNKPKDEAMLRGLYESDVAREEALKSELAEVRRRLRHLRAIMPARLHLSVRGQQTAAERDFVEDLLASEAEGLTSKEVMQTAQLRGYEPIASADHPWKAASAALWSLVKTGRVYRSAGGKFRLRKEFR